MWILNALMGCSHRKTTFPLTPRPKCNPPPLIPSTWDSFLRLSLYGMEGSVQNQRA